MHGSRCRATRRDGTPCRAPAGPDGYCWAHSPARRDERRAARSKGGRNRARAARLDRLVPATLRPVVSLLLDALEEVHEGTLQPSRATAMAALASATIRVYEVAEIERRLDALEHQAEGRTPA